MAERWELTDEQWALVEPVLRPRRRKDNRGRPWQGRSELNDREIPLGKSEIPAIRKEEG